MLVAVVEGRSHAPRGRGSSLTMGTVAAAAAPGFEVLLVGRVFQAAGPALMLPLLMTVILVLVPMERRGAMMSTASMVISVAPAIAQPYQD
ncbi:hypothetical protein [Herpetosiphon gulosus]|uniref:Major facilitator superfamily (MFS) profile domain-containing protein n=1 Tax=Herpetosiphon gulosus TaxID=1973496 RepID=A0ABP9X7Y7_9CHLR